MVQQWSVLSGFTQLHSASLPFCVCAFAKKTNLFNMNYMKIMCVRVSACVRVHACVCMGMFIPALLPHISQIASAAPSLSFLVPGCFGRLRLFLSNLQAVIGVMCSR